MITRVSAKSLCIAAIGFILTVGGSGSWADTGTAQPSAPAQSSNPAQAFSSMANGTFTTDPAGTAAAPKRHHHSHHSSPAAASASTASSASWLPAKVSAPVDTASAAPARASTEVPISNTFSKPSTESHVSDWMPSSASPDTPADAAETSARIDLIAQKYGQQATVDFNSRIQEPDGVIAFRAIDNQTGERETIRIDRSGDIKLKSGWAD